MYLDLDFVALDVMKDYAKIKNVLASKKSIDDLLSEMQGLCDFYRGM